MRGKFLVVLATFFLATVSFAQAQKPAAIPRIGILRAAGPLRTACPTYSFKRFGVLGMLKEKTFLSTSAMPKEIEDYVHEIGRTGRSGKTGIATTFINMNTSEQTLLDLKYLLMEAKQK